MANFYRIETCGYLQRQIKALKLDVKWLIMAVRGVETSFLYAKNLIVTLKQSINQSYSILLLKALLCSRVQISVKGASLYTIRAIQYCCIGRLLTLLKNAVYCFSGQRTETKVEYNCCSGISLDALFSADVFYRVACNNTLNKDFIDCLEFIVYCSNINKTTKGFCKCNNGD